MVVDRERERQRARSLLCLLFRPFYGFYDLSFTPKSIGKALSPNGALVIFRWVGSGYVQITSYPPGTEAHPHFADFASGQSINKMGGQGCSQTGFRLSPARYDQISSRRSLEVSSLALSKAEERKA